jgi:pimeloyl-ACP methyl ester carboxylesterase
MSTSVSGIFTHWSARRIELVSQHRSQLDLLAVFADARITVPALYIVGDRDLTLGFHGMDDLLLRLPTLVPRQRPTVVLPGCGHWTQQERSREVSVAMIDFLEACNVARPASSVCACCDQQRGAPSVR